MKIIKIVLIVLVVGVAGFTGWHFFHKAQVRRIPETNLFSLGQVAASQGDYKKAVEYYTILLSKDPRHTIAWDFLIDCQEKMGDVQNAIVSSEKLIALDRSQKYVERLIRLYRQSGQEDRAKALQESLTSH